MDRTNEELERRQQGNIIKQLQGSALAKYEEEREEIEANLSSDFKLGPLVSSHKVPLPASCWNSLRCS